MKKTILILHGWGVDSGKYLDLKQLLENLGFTVFVPDLPGFGKQKLLKNVMNVDDYVDFVKEYIKKNNLEHIIVIAHSFGARIAIKLIAPAKHPVSRLILTGAAGIKPRLAFSKRTLQYFAISLGELSNYPMFSFLKQKIRKILYFIIGEWDYYNAGDLRETFKKVIAEDLLSYLPKIDIPALLVWGENDKVIPVLYGKKMQQLIPNSKLILVEETGHKLPYEAPQRFVEAIKSFIL